MNRYLIIFIIGSFCFGLHGQTRFHDDAEKVFEKVQLLISQDKIEHAESLLLPIKSRLMSQSISRNIWDFFTFNTLTAYEIQLAVLKENYEDAVEISKKAQEKIKPGIRSDDQMAIGYYSHCINEQLYGQIAENYSLSSLESAKLNLKILQGKVNSHRFQFPSTKKNVLKMLDLQMNQIEVKLESFQE